MPTVDAPQGDMLCASIPHTITAVDIGDCLTLQWVPVTYPSAVSPDDIEFSAPNSEVTQVIVPIEGIYDFAFECCSEAP